MRLAPAVESAKIACLQVPVAAEVPAVLVGAGSGLLNESGALSIQTDHTDTLREHGLDRLRLGDVVAIRDYDSRWGHGYRRGSVAIGDRGITATAYGPVMAPA